MASTSYADSCNSDDDSLNDIDYAASERDNEEASEGDTEDEVEREEEKAQPKNTKWTDMEILQLKKSFRKNLATRIYPKGYEIDRFILQNSISRKQSQVRSKLQHLFKDINRAESPQN